MSFLILVTYWVVFQSAWAQASLVDCAIEAIHEGSQAQVVPVKLKHFEPVKNAVLSVTRGLYVPPGEYIFKADTTLKRGPFFYPAINPRYGKLEDSIRNGPVQASLETLFLKRKQVSLVLLGIASDGGELTPDELFLVAYKGTPLIAESARLWRLSVAPDEQVEVVTEPTEPEPTQLIPVQQYQQSCYSSQGVENQRSYQQYSHMKLPQRTQPIYLGNDNFRIAAQRSSAVSSTQCQCICINGQAHWVCG